MIRVKFGRVLRRAFDVELLHIAQCFNIPIAEVAVNWTEIDGNVTRLFLLFFDLLLHESQVRQKCEKENGKTPAAPGDPHSPFHTAIANLRTHVIGCAATPRMAANAFDAKVLVKRANLPMFLQFWWT